jgi:hypothetical protein
VDAREGEEGEREPMEASGESGERQRALLDVGLAEVSVDI